MRYKLVICDCCNKVMRYVDKTKDYSERFSINNVHVSYHDEKCFMNRYNEVKKYILKLKQFCKKHNDYILHAHYKEMCEGAWALDMIYEAQEIERKMKNLKLTGITLEDRSFFINNLNEIYKYFFEKNSQLRICL